MPKDALRIEAYGTVDELNAFLGVARAASLDARLEHALEPIQNQLFHLGSDLCILEEDKVRLAVPRVEERHVRALEELIDELTRGPRSARQFHPPGGQRRGLAPARRPHGLPARRAPGGRPRRARRASAPGSLAYLNRLSDALFVMARWENRAKGVADVLWNSRA